MPNQFRPNFELRAVAAINVDGVEYPANAVVAVGESAPDAFDTLEDKQAMRRAAFERIDAQLVKIESALDAVAVVQTPHHVDDLRTLLAVGRVAPVWVGDGKAAAPHAAMASGPAASPAAAPTPPADPFAAEERAAAAAVAKAAEAAGPDAKPVLPEGLNGLPVRIAEALAAADLTTAAAIRGYIDRGNDLDDVDGLGKAAIKKINDWLAEQPQLAADGE